MLAISFAGERLGLSNGEKLMAVLALVEVVLRVLEEKLQLYHEEARNEFILPLLGFIKLFDRDPASQFADERRVNAASVYLELYNLVEIRDQELNRVLYYRFKAEELR